MRRGHSIHPGAVFLIHSKEFGGQRVDRDLTFFQRRADRPLQGDIAKGLPIFGSEGVKEYDRGNCSLSLLCYAGDDHATIGVPHQYKIFETFPINYVDDVGDVSLEVHLCVKEMRALAHSSHRWGEDLMALFLQEV